MMEASQGKRRYPTQDFSLFLVQTTKKEKEKETRKAFLPFHFLLGSYIFTQKEVGWASFLLLLTAAAATALQQSSRLGSYGLGSLCLSFSRQPSLTLCAFDGGGSVPFLSLSLGSKITPRSQREGDIGLSAVLFSTRKEQEEDVSFSLSSERIDSE